MSTKRASKGNGHAEPQPSPRDIYQTLVRISVPKAPKDETPEQERERMEIACRKICGAPISALELPKERKRLTWTLLLNAAVAKRWNAKLRSFRAFFAAEGKDARRRPTYKQNPGFFADLKKYGHARFTERGALDRESLDAGPGPWEFEQYTKPGSDRRATD